MQWLKNCGKVSGALMRESGAQTACRWGWDADFCTMGKAVASTALSMIREVVFGVGFALLLPVFFGLGGVLASMPVSDILTFIVAVFLIFRTYKELSARDKQPA